MGIIWVQKYFSFDCRCNSFQSLHSGESKLDEKGNVFSMNAEWMWSREYTRGGGKPRRGVTSSACLSVPRLVVKNVFQFTRGAAFSIHTAHEETNSSGLPHFDLLTTDGSDRSQGCQVIMRKIRVHVWKAIRTHLKNQ